MAFSAGTETRIGKIAGTGILPGQGLQPGPELKYFLLQVNFLNLDFKFQHTFYKNFYNYEETN